MSPTAGQTAPLHVGIAGHGDAADACARALRGCEGVSTIRLSGRGDDLLDTLSAEGLDAVALCDARDTAALAKRAILARKHVLALAPVADSRQLLLLDELARGRALTLLFDACGLADEAVDVARRLARAGHILRQPRFVRAFRNAPGASLDSAALVALSRLLALAGETPAHVGAFAPAVPDDERPGLLHISMRFSSGLAASLDVTTLGPAPHDELIALCAGRTLTIDALDPVAPLRVLAAVRQGGANKFAEERQAVAPRPAPERIAAAFIDAVRAGAPASNARELALAALTWETARTSVARGGDFTALPANHPLSATARPSLHVIEGSGEAIDDTAEHAPPRLRLVHGGRRDVPTAPPPRSA